MKDPVAKTALLVAALRAEESERADRLFDDPFARDLAGDEGREVLAQYRASARHGLVPVIEVRTRYFDETLLRACAAGLRQVVVLAAGMDARAFRLAWPEGVRLFEIDQPEMIEAKARILRAAEPTCSRTAIAADLAQDWPKLLEARGFDRRETTVWLVEGLLQYLDAAAVDRLVERLDSLSSPGSVMIFDIVGQSLLDCSAVASTLKMMSDLGAPWRFGTDEPASLVTRHGWRAVAIEPAVIGNAWHRWPFPPVPAGIAGVPRSYFVEATKNVGPSA
jgi:methyltransferase (TIGR00027 family)